MLTAWTLNMANMNILIRFTKTREIFPSVTQILSISLIASATRASVEREKFKKREAEWLATCDRKATVPDSSPAASYAQRWALCSNNLANI